VKVTSKGGDLPLKQVQQPEYGNEVLYAETAKADKDEYKFSVEYEVVRKEHVVLVNGKQAGAAPAAKAPHVELARFLEPDRLEKAKDIYEYVFRTMKYDKSGTGWGQGHALGLRCEARQSVARTNADAIIVIGVVRIWVVGGNCVAGIVVETFLAAGDLADNALGLAKFVAQDHFFISSEFWLEAIWKNAPLSMTRTELRLGERGMS
jgi:hypothetical protein